MSFWVSSQLEFLSFITVWGLSFPTIWVIEFHYHLSFWVSSQFEFLSFIWNWVFEFHHNLSFITILVEFHHKWSLIFLWKKRFFLWFFFITFSQSSADQRTDARTGGLTEGRTNRRTDGRTDRPSDPLTDRQTAILLELLWAATKRFNAKLNVSQ